MSKIELWGEVELGIVFEFVEIGVYMELRVIDFKDMKVDG